MSGKITPGPDVRTVDQGACLGIPVSWQEPAITEKAAWESIIQTRPEGFIYIGVPWATIIDGVRNDTPAAWQLVEKLKVLKARLATMSPDMPRVTTAQHINALSYESLFQYLGITDIFWSHALKEQPRSPGGINIHGFPLFPAQTGYEAYHEGIHRPRRWLTNFIGAYNSKIYLSDVRARIFADESAPDLHIVKREGWHFDRAVYAEQIQGLSADEARLAEERRRKEEYLEAIRDSVFTLCPTGSGPNSIRIYEALALGSIPVILTEDLAMPGDAAFWEEACLFHKDSGDGYSAALERMRAMPAAEVKERQVALKRLYSNVSPSSYGTLIERALSFGAPCKSKESPETKHKPV